MPTNSLSSTSASLSLSDFFRSFIEQEELLGAELSNFFAGFERAYEQARTDRAASTPHLDVLRVFGLEFAELRHSDVLAWFLHPKAEHEQGPFFASTLLQWLGYQPIYDENYEVMRERHGHTDVSLYANGRFAVFIENKVRHHESDQQISSMIHSMASLCAMLGIPRERRFAIFLTDSGKPPTSGPKEDSSEFLLANLRWLCRVDLFELLLTNLETQPIYSPLLSGFAHSYLNSVRRLRARLP